MLKGESLSSRLLSSHKTMCIRLQSVLKSGSPESEDKRGFLGWKCDTQIGSQSEAKDKYKDS